MTCASMLIVASAVMADASTSEACHFRADSVVRRQDLVQACPCMLKHVAVLSGITSMAMCAQKLQSSSESLR